MPEDKSTLETEYFKKRWQEGAQMEKERSEGKTRWEDIEGKVSLQRWDGNIGLKHGGFLLDAYLRKASEPDIYLVALCGK